MSTDDVRKRLPLIARRVVELEAENERLRERADRCNHPDCERHNALVVAQQADRLRELEAALASERSVSEVSKRFHDAMKAERNLAQYQRDRLAARVELLEEIVRDFTLHSGGMEYDDWRSLVQRGDAALEQKP